jgi:hypothetical protein
VTPLRWPLKLLLVFNVFYCLVGTITKTAPAWRMFEKADRLEYSFQDVTGEHVHVADYLPRNAFVISWETLLPVLRFICQRYPEKGPYLLRNQTRNLILKVGAVDDCAVPPSF